MAIVFAGFLLSLTALVVAGLSLPKMFRAGSTAAVLMHVVTVGLGLIVLWLWATNIYDYVTGDQYGDGWAQLADLAIAALCSVGVFVFSGLAGMFDRRH